MRLLLSSRICPCARRRVGRLIFQSQKPVGCLFSRLRHHRLSPRLAPERFAAAIGQCDVVLDSIGWSGCNSILESLVHDLPIVTLAGDFMRGRHAAAILAMMGIRDTTADSIDSFVSIAAALADPAMRMKVSSRIAAQKACLYRDLECIAGLESFLEEAVRKPKN